MPPSGGTRPAGLSPAAPHRHHPRVNCEPIAAPPARPGDRIDDPLDVRFAIHALLGCVARDDADRAAARDAILAGLPPAPTVRELVDAVFAWRRRAGPPGEGDEAGRRHARGVLEAYFVLDPPLGGPGRAGEPG